MCFCQHGKTITISSVTSEFRDTGIYRFDRNILPVEAFAPSLPTHRLEALNEEVESDYDADDYFLLEILRQKLNTTENSFSKVLPTPDLERQKSKNTSRRKALNYKAIKVKRDVFRKDKSPEFFTTAFINYLISLLHRVCGRHPKVLRV
ncbi:hypothetical protein Trydic_g7955 [Trypoxylus dichotomus]